MFACFWWALDTDGRAWCFRSFEHEGLTPQDAAACMIENTLKDETITVTYAPQDMWSRQRESGRTTADIMTVHGVPIVKSDNNRVQGHMVMRSLLEPVPLHDEYVIKRLFGGKTKAPKELPAIMFFDNVGQVIEDIQSIQHDDVNPNDCAKEPHDITHTIDAVRYFAINRQIMTEKPTVPIEKDPHLLSLYAPEEDDDVSGMIGGDPTDAYMEF